MCIYNIIYSGLHLLTRVLPEYAEKAGCSFFSCKKLVLIAQALRQRFFHNISDFVYSEFVPLVDKHYFQNLYHQKAVEDLHNIAPRNAVNCLTTNRDLDRAYIFFYLFLFYVFDTINEFSFSLNICPKLNCQ
ncbi:hypothetical protein VNO77_05935 [Canavalia gladiata]|uniref:Uncharacterized protein n=1 Tax=Canavalia gladiata TaxID=3824 RepID=A0AAN9N4E1_CANGL